MSEGLLPTVEGTWAEIGHRMKCYGRTPQQGRNLLVRLIPESKTTAGGIILTDRTVRLYKGAPHRHILQGLALDVPPNLGFSAGDLIIFPRTFLNRLVEIAHGEWVCSIPERQVLGRHAGESP